MPPEDWVPEEETSAESSDLSGSTGNVTPRQTMTRQQKNQPHTLAGGFNTSYSSIHWSSDAKDGGEWMGATKWARSACSKASGSNATAGWEGIKATERRNDLFFLDFWVSRYLSNPNSV